VIRRITHHHAVIGPPNPIEVAVHTSDLITHSYFGDHPAEFERLADAVHTALLSAYPQSVSLEEVSNARPVSRRRKPSRTPDQR